MVDCLIEARVKEDAALKGSGIFLVLVLFFRCVDSALPFKA